jgi:hypothetical protein
VRIALVLFLSFIGFAAGALSARRQRLSRYACAAHPAEVLIVILALIVIAVLRPASHPAAYAAVCVVAMAGLGFLAARVAGAGDSLMPGGTREFEAIRTSDAGQTAWRRYLNLSRALADYEFRLILVAIYLLFAAPIALLAGFGRNSARGRGDSNWVARGEAGTLEKARRPF